MMDKIHYLYRIINNHNNKIYVGQTVNPRSRWYQHKSDAIKDNPVMTISYALRKYGIENFSFEIIATCKNLDDANYVEMELIKQYESHISTGKGYNISFGGLNSPRVSPSTETRQKMSKSHTGKRHTQISIKKMSEVQSGKVITEDAKQKMSNAKKGKKLSPEHAQNISKSLKGKPAHNKGKSVSSETRKKISDSMKNKSRSVITVGN